MTWLLFSSVLRLVSSRYTLTQSATRRHCNLVGVKSPGCDILIWLSLLRFDCMCTHLDHTDTNVFSGHHFVHDCIPSELAFFLRLPVAAGVEEDG